NGEVAESSPTAITRSLPAGVHRVDIFIASSVSAKPTFALMCDSPEPPYMIEPPSEMFDPTKQPEIASAFKGQGATVTPAEGNGKFTIGFAPQTQGRVVRLV